MIGKGQKLDMKIRKEMIHRVLIYILGLAFLAFAVAFSANSNLGISPVNSLPYILSLIFNVKMSICVIAVFSFYILLQVIILRKEFKWYNVFQLLFSTIFGYFVDFAKAVLGDFSIPTYAGQLTMMAISILLTAIGISLYVDVDLIPMPMEGLTLSLSRKSGKIPFHNMKIIADCIVVVLGAILSLVFLHRLDGVREGTIITALVVGKVVAITQKMIKPWVNRICFPCSDSNYS